MRVQALASTAGLILLIACADNPKSDIMPTAPMLAVSTLPTVDQVVDGSTGRGSLYRLVRPANWNGSLLIYAHGYVSPDQPIALPAEGNLLISLLAPEGFAVAYSSFSENGWDVKDGAQRTHQLLVFRGSR